jgi:hypothetical protein
MNKEIREQNILNCKIAKVVNIESKEDVKKCYWLTQKGTPITLGYVQKYGQYERTREHVELMEALKIRCNNFMKMFNDYKVVQIIPEYNACAFPSNMRLTKEQKEFINKWNLELIRE